MDFYLNKVSKMDIYRRIPINDRNISIIKLKKKKKLHIYIIYILFLDILLTKMKRFLIKIKNSIIKKIII